MKRLPWRPVPFAIGIALLLSMRHGADVDDRAPNRSAAVAAVLAARGFTCDEADVTWIGGPNGVHGAMTGGARALVRASVKGEPSNRTSSKQRSRRNRAGGPRPRPGATGAPRPRPGRRRQPAGRRTARGAARAGPPPAPRQGARAPARRAAPRPRSAGRVRDLAPVAGLLAAMLRGVLVSGLWTGHHPPGRRPGGQRRHQRGQPDAGQEQPVDSPSGQQYAQLNQARVAA